MPKLIVSADDIGLTDGNTETIFESVDKGGVRSVSVLVNGLAFEKAITGYLMRKDVLRIAVHLNLTDGESLTGVSALTDDQGIFRYSPFSLPLAYFFASQRRRRALVAHIEQELSAQIQKVRNALKLPNEATLPVDGHQHVHMLPFVFDAIMRVSRSQPISEIRIPDEPFYVAHTLLSAYTLPHLIGVGLVATFARSARRKAARASVRTNDSFVGVLFSGRMGKRAAEAGLKTLVNGHHERTEILFHPGSARPHELDTWKGIIPWHYDNTRNVERAYVMSDGAKRLFEEYRNGTLPAGPDFSKLLRYLASGTLAASIHLGGLYLFTEYTHIWYVYANVLAFSIGLSVSFLLQKFWTFADHTTHRIHHQALIYSAMQLVSLGINTGGLYLLVQYAHLWYVLAEFLLLVGVAVANFFISNLVIFKKSR